MTRDEQPQRRVQEREKALADRESAIRVREEDLRQREQTQRFLAEAQEDAAASNREMRQANQNLVIATLKAEGLSESAELAHRQQDEFLAMLAHELRNPLAPIRNATALLARLNPGEPVPPLIHQVIERQVKHMARLLDDLLDASRVTSGKVHLQRRPTMVSEFVDLAVETCRSLINANQQTLTLDFPEVPIYVDGDPLRLEQVVGNLLHNAAKYTQAGGAIAVRARGTEDKVEIRVSDNGIGIAPEALPHIFALFAQTDRSLSRSQGGLGIGLTVVRSVVELHGGTVQARSGGPNRGSEFIVTLPRIDHVEGPQTTANEAAEQEPKPVKASILVIDDNADACEVLAQLLRMAGHDVSTALDGPSALDTFERVRPQVVVCDIGLPVMDGYEVAKRLREQGDAPMPLLIALTGYGGPMDRERALSAGFQHHLIKPAEPEALLHLIESSLQPDAVRSRQLLSLQKTVSERRGA